MMNDVIYRQAAIDALKRDEALVRVFGYQHAIDEIQALPSAEPDLDEWCTDCKEYDQKRHCCPRWNRVIRETLKDVKRKPGKWQIRETAYGDVEAKCPRCGFETLVNQPGNGLHMVNDLHFCPNCGEPLEVR